MIRFIHWPARAWFLEITFVRNVGVCVSPQGYKLHSHDTVPVQPVEQVQYI